MHVGSGTGYYAAILAELVGRAGRVIAYEIDAGLAARATRNLREWGQVTVVAANGCDLPTREVDAIFVNCGVTHPAPAWLDALCNGGRLLVPVTASAEASGVGTGAMFMITREHDRFAAAYVSKPWASFLRWRSKRRAERKVTRETESQLARGQFDTH